MKTLDQWKADFSKGDLRALSRFISLAENHDPSITSVLAELYGKIGKAKIIGITGPPGAGKSSLTSHFVRLIRENKKTVGVIAVDPVSPFSGGALLGDRIRLADHFNDEGVFIRSLSTRGKLGGLSLATREVAHLGDAFGLDYLIIETVGVGQSEVDVRNVADVTLVVLVPEWGDAIQTLKAGLLEIGDVFIVNKSDREGADRIATELKNMLQMAKKDGTEVLLTSTQQPETVKALFASLERYLSANREKLAGKRKASARETACELMESLVAREARAWVESQSKETANPYTFIQEFLKKHPSGTLFKK